MAIDSQHNNIHQAHWRRASVGLGGGRDHGRVGLRRTAGWQAVARAGAGRMSADSALPERRAPAASPAGPLLCRRARARAPRTAPTPPAGCPSAGTMAARLQPSGQQAHLPASGHHIQAVGPSSGLSPRGPSTSAQAASQWEVLPAALPHPALPPLLAAPSLTVIAALQQHLVPWVRGRGSGGSSMARLGCCCSGAGVAILFPRHHGRQRQRQCCLWAELPGFAFSPPVRQPQRCLVQPNGQHQPQSGVCMIKGREDRRVVDVWVVEQPEPGSSYFAIAICQSDTATPGAWGTSTRGGTHQR